MAGNELKEGRIEKAWGRTGKEAKEARGNGNAKLRVSGKSPERGKG